MMSGIGSKNTKPELLVRKALFARGFRYRLHEKLLPGKPDMVFPKYRTALFVHGCFWHGHACKLFKWPQSNTTFWQNKIAGNMARFEQQRLELNALGWKVIVVYECQTRQPRAALELLIDELTNKLKAG
jgi:DNA mismatch endonuclease (patch repair protein)